MAVTLLAAGLAGQTKTLSTSAILREVEKRYNSTKTLEATFTQTLVDRGRTRAVKKGTLYLSKPKKTRWQYSTPAGDWFLSDASFAYNYDKAKNEVERIKMRETDDMRIPLAFLLGTLDFQKDFREFRARAEGGGTYITLTPKNEKLLFREVAMLVASDFTIKKVNVTGQDFSINEFVLDGEKRNQPLAASLFEYKTPAGAKVIDSE